MQEYVIPIFIIFAGTFLLGILRHFLNEYVEIQKRKFQRDSEQKDLREFEDMVVDAVQAAEQIFGSGTGPKKYEFVFNLLKRHFPAIDDDIIRIAIESAVAVSLYFTRDRAPKN